MGRGDEGGCILRGFDENVKVKGGYRSSVLGDVRGEY